MHILTFTDHWFIRPLVRFEHGIYPRDDAGWQPATVPGHWQQLPGLEKHAGKVVYRCRFPFVIDGYSPKEQAAQSFSRYWLKLNGSFYYSQPYLNGVDLGRHEGYFQPIEREVTYLLDDENTLLVEVDCPDEHDKVGKRMITGVFSHWDCLDPEANPGGLWLPVELHRSGPVRLHQARLHTERIEGDAMLRYGVDLDAAADGPIRLRWTFTPKTFAGEMQVLEHYHTLRQGRQDIEGSLNLHNPRLWWTHDLGRPDLYDVHVELFWADQLSDCQQFAFGVRQFEMRNWIGHLNGVRFLIKGNNYPPGDMRIATMNRERVARDLQLVRECHMNFLRIHAHVDHPALYEEADAQGILLWQDFPLQWLYRRAVLPEALRQVREMVHLLYNHPSIVIWCMHNEPVYLADTHDEGLWPRLRTYGSAFGFGWNRDVLDTRLKRMVQALDPTREVVRSSGEFDVPFYRQGTDSHAYFGWYDSYGTLERSEVLMRRLPGNLRFCTEFGAQSFPNYESAINFMDTELTALDVKYLAQRHGFQADILSKWINWRGAVDLQAAIKLSQDYQILINRYYIDRLRYHKYRPTGGIVPFLLLDPWPAVLWSVIDYWRVPKRSYYAMKQAMAPQYAFSIFPPGKNPLGKALTLPIYAVNDGRDPVALRLQATLQDETGAVIATVQHALRLPADSLAQEIDRLRFTPNKAGHYELIITLSGGVEEIHNRYEIVVV
jgi:beta-mannosidase